MSEPKYPELFAAGDTGSLPSSSLEDKKIETPQGSVDAEEIKIEILHQKVPKEIGLVSACFLIFNRMVGTGIFATPSSIFTLSGSVGLSLILWVVGGIIAASGLMVYLEWGSQIPRNGAEKNYLQYFYQKPRFLAMSMYAVYVVALGWAASNSVVFGEYIINAAGKEVTRWNQRGIGLACVTFCFLIHAFALKWGLRLQNLLGVFKLVIIILITVTGWVALSGRIHSVTPTHNFSNAFDNYNGESTSSYGVVMALYNVIWSYVGYSNANYALAEAKNPRTVLKIGAPVALVSVSVLYLFVNIAYFAVVPKDEIAASGRILAASFFRIVFGRTAEKALSVFVALSALGNVLSVIFSQGRIVQELAKEGLLPFSKVFASNKPLNAPFAGLAEHWAVSVIIMLAPPPGDAYNFILNLISYPLSIVNAFVALASLILYFRPFPDWNPPIRASWPVTLFFLLASIYLVVAPYVPPSAGQNVYEHLPYYLHCVVGTALFVVGAILWYIWVIVLPKFRKYSLRIREVRSQDDEFIRNEIYKQFEDGRVSNGLF